MKKIYILLMHTNTIPSKLIRFFTRYKYTHVGLALEPSCTSIYSFGRKNLHSIFHSGFTIENKNGAFFQTFHQTVCRIYEVDVSIKEYKKIKQVLTDMTNQIQIYKYDFVGLIPRFLGIPITLKNRYVCSFFVAEVLKKAKVLDFKKKVCLVHPRDFTKLNKLKLIYEGKFLLYKGKKIS